jgi:hypothetical protein
MNSGKLEKSLLTNHLPTFIIVDAAPPIHAQLQKTKVLRTQLQHQGTLMQPLQRICRE